MTVFDRYLEQAKDFARKLVRTETGTRRWATVTSVDPILITYDGPAPQGIISPVVLGTPVTIGDRVRAHTIHDRTYITRANPTPPEPSLAILDDGLASVTETVDAGEQITVDVDFPNPLPTAQRVMVTMTGTNRLLPRVLTASVSPTGFQVQLRNVSTGGTSSVSFWWIAIGLEG